MATVCHAFDPGLTVGPEQLFWALRARPGLVWLDGGPRTSSLFSWGPESDAPQGPDWPRRVREMLHPGPRYREAPFAGGVLGYLGYEAGRHVERMPEPQASPLVPDVGLRRYPGGLWFHPRPARWVAAGTPEFVAEARTLVEGTVETVGELPTVHGRLDEPDRPLSFPRAVARVQAFITAGDCYQVNLARRFALDGVDDPAAAYLRLRRRSPAPYGAWLAVPGAVVLSNSPEAFLRVRGVQVSSRPIKGTRPRVGDHRDRAYRADLASDAKERAELTMIVDLVRNDLGRVCRPGSILTSPRKVYPLPTVHHAEQVVTGTLAGGRDALDALMACFPPGSVTGAPKVRAMEIIGELEPVPRSVSYGAIGYLADSGDAGLSVAIRTAIWVDGRAWVHVGGGIVADSDPAREWEETRWKARALLDALAGSGTSR